MSNIFHFENTKPRKFAGGDLFRASKKNFDALEGIAIQSLHLKEGAIREPHIHPNAHQLDYCVTGTARVGIIGPDGERQLLDLKKGDISFVPQGHLHWIENTGDKALHFLVALSHEEPETIELSEMLANVPRETLAAIFGVSEKALESLPTKTILISEGRKHP